jgi:hypothetical protein
MAKQRWQFLFADDFDMNERGCTLFLSAEGSDWIAYWDLKHGRYLRVAIVPDSYPGISVTVAQHDTEEAFVQHIRDTYANWMVRHSNIDALPAKRFVDGIDD